MARFINLNESFGDFEFGDIIKMKRKEKGWSIHEVARRTGVSQSYINRLELKDQKNVTVPILVKVCEVLEIDIKEGLRAFGYNAGEKQGEEENLLLVPVREGVEGAKKDWVYNVVHALLNPNMSDLEKMEICLNGIKKLSQ